MTTIAFKDGSVVVYPEGNFIKRRLDDGLNEIKTAHDGDVIAEVLESDIEEQHVTNPPQYEEEQTA